MSFALFLLCGAGPVPWRKEIMEGVAHASKVVFFIDEAWCTSYNCLQELAFAKHHSKPLVVLVLDQQAWEMLTIPGGAESAWTNDCWGPSLMSYEGEEISPGVIFDAATVRRLYSQISSINLCPCRELDEANWGLAGVLDNALKYVTKDLEYHKEHAELTCFVVRWEDGQKTPSLLLNDSETIRWERWVDAAKAAEIQPAPTEKQKEFLRECRRWKKTRHQRLRVAVIAALLCILAGAVASVFMAFRYRDERAVAIQQQELATQLMLKAQRVSAASTARSLLTQIGLSTSPNEMPVREAQWHLTAAKLVAQANDTGLYSWARDMLRHTLSKPWANIASLQLNHMAVAVTRTSLAWSSDGSWLAAYTMAGEALAWNIGSGSIQPVLLAYNDSGANETAEGFSAGNVAWSPDGLQLAVSYPKGRVAIWDLGLPGDHQLVTKVFEPPHVSWREKAIAFVIGDSPLYNGTEPSGYDKTALEKIAKAVGSESLDTAAEFLDATLDMQKPGLSALAWSSKGRMLASSSPLVTNIVVWSVGSNVSDEDTPFVQFEPGANIVNALAWSPDGKVLAVGGRQSDNGCIYIGLWTISSAGEVFNVGEYTPGGECNGKEDVTADLCWLHGGNSLVALSRSGLQTTLDFITGEVRDSADHRAIGISTSSAGVALALESGGIIVSSRDGRQVSAFMEGEAVDGGIAFSPDGSLLACTNAAGPVLVWRHSLLSDNPFRRLLLPPVPVDHLRMSPNAKLWSGYKQMAASSEAGEADGVSLLHVWNLDDVFNAQEGVWGPWMHRIALQGADCCLYDWSPDSTSIAAPITVIQNGTTLMELGVWRVTRSPGLNDTASSADQVPDGFSAELIVESVLSSASPYASFHVLKWSPDGSMIASISTTGGMTVWNVSSGQSQSLSLAEGSEPVLLHFPMWSSDSRYLSAGAYQGGGIHIWDLGKPVGNITESMTLPSSVPRYPFVHWSPSDPRTFAVMLLNHQHSKNIHTRQSQIELWEFPKLAGEGTPPELWGSLPGFAVALSWRPGTKGNSKQLATLGGYNATSLQIWDVSSAEAVLLDGPIDTGLDTDFAGYYVISWAPNGQTIAVSSDQDDVAKIYDVESTQVHALVCPVSLGWLHWEGEYAWACSSLQSNNAVSADLHVDLTVSYDKLQDRLSGMIPIPLQDANLEEAEQRLPSATLADPAMCHHVTHQ